MKKLLLIILLFTYSLFANTIILTSGNPKSGFINQGDTQYYKIVATANQTLDVLLNQLSADADIYVKIGEEPTLTSYDCKSENSEQNNETCLLNIPQNSDVFIGVYGFRTAHYTVKATLSTPHNEPTILHSDVPVNDTVIKNAMKYYKISATSNKTLDVLLSQLSADADLYVKIGEKPTLNNYDCKSEESAQSNDSCLLNITENSDVFIGVYGFRTADYQLKATIKSKISVIYEDAEDQTIDRWTIVDDTPSGATISNAYDTDIASRVIKFTGVDNYGNQYQIGGNWNNTTNKNLLFDLKTTLGYIIDITVSTPNGERYLRYNDNNISYIELNGDAIMHGLGYFSTDGTWHRHIRNLEKDLQDLEPTNTITSVDSFAIRAIASIDNLELFSLPKKVYENAEDSQTNRWSIYAGPNNAQITNIYDSERESRVISFQGNNSENKYLIGNKVGEENAWEDKEHSNLKWSFKSNSTFKIYLFVNTLNGKREIKYSNTDIGTKGIQGNEIYFGVGEDASDGKWHTFIRDITTDVKYFENNNSLLSIDGLLVVGNSKIDDLELFNVFKPQEHKAGVSLTFDDYGVDSWYSMKDTFLEYNTKATFFVSQFHTLSDTEVNKLKSLEQDGHEIGCHTYTHLGVGRDFNYDNNRIDEYLNSQIIPAYNNMKNAGFNPVSFAYPYGEHNDAYDNAVRTYFPYLRTTASDANRRLYQLEEIFHKKGKHYTILAADGIDNSYHNELDEIREAFIKARENGEIITLYAHRVEDDNSDYAISPQKLESVIKMAQEIGLKFYTFKESYTIGQ